jgi:EAL and modified HD-GYP domain-containing signal transduction protein
VATRLTVFPVRPDAAPEAAALLAALAETWPADTDTGATGLLLNVTSEPLLQALLAQARHWRPMLEVPAFFAAEPGAADALLTYIAGGGAVALRGRPQSPLPAALAARLDHLIGPPGTSPGAGPATLVVEGDGRMATLDAAFAAGAVGVLGWPFADEPAGHGARAMPPDVQVIVELIDRVRREEPLERLEAVLQKDPTVAFRLLRYLNSPAFGLTVEIGSLRHALMLLGYQRLSRWLALLLASASKEPNMRPVMHAAIRRGLLFEELLRTSDDAELRAELFICGIFSLLDLMLRQPFADLLKTVPVSARVQQALVDGEGPLQPYLELARAIENASLLDLREAAERLMISPAELNRALLRTLVAARGVV